MKTIAITSQKGGTAKTTTAYALGACLYNRGMRVLYVDFDPQCNLAFSSGIMPDDGTTKTLYDVLKGAYPVTECIYPVDDQETLSGCRDLVIGGLGLAAADMEFTQLGREYILRNILDGIREQYDYCIVDCPPSLGVLTMNALTAADICIIPIGADAFSLQGVTQLEKYINLVKQFSNKALTVGGLLLTRYSERKQLSKDLSDIIKQAAESLGTKVYTARIRESESIRKAQLSQVNLFSNGKRKKTNAVMDYEQFANELLKDMGV